MIFVHKRINKAYIHIHMLQCSSLLTGAQGELKFAGVAPSPPAPTAAAAATANSMATSTTNIDCTTTPNSHASTPSSSSSSSSSPSPSASAEVCYSKSNQPGYCYYRDSWRRSSRSQMPRTKSVSLSEMWASGASKKSYVTPWKRQLLDAKAPVAWPPQFPSRTPALGPVVYKPSIITNITVGVPFCVIL